MKRTLAWVGIIFLGGIFAAVFINVLEMRIGKGDVFPHYSSYRTDPLGASGLYEAFGRLPGMTVVQNQESLMQIDSLDGDTALFLLGVPKGQFGQLRIPDDSPVLEAIEKRGARLILTVNPERVPDKHINTLTRDEEEWMDERREEREELRRRVKEAREEESDESEKEKPAKKRTKNARDDEEEDFETEMELNRLAAMGPRLEHRWGISIADVAKFDRPEEGWAVESKELKSGTMPMWKSPYYFDFDFDHKKDWNVIATSRGKPVVAERKIGRGSVVLTTDSFFAANESLYNGGDSSFLLWLTGGKTTLVFDETIHGSVDRIGAVKLLRQYRLHGFFIGIFIFVLLWAWKSAGSLAPGDEAGDRGIISADGAVSGEDAKSGLVRLLQCSIPGNELINRCLATWQESQTRKLPAEQERLVAEIARKHSADPRKHGILETYRKISEVLRQR